MAVIDAFPGARISIVAGDITSKEYQDHDEEEPDKHTITRYVEAKSDQEFRIECEIKHGLIKKKRTPGNCLGVHVYVDGNRVDQFIVTRKDVAHSAFLTESIGLDKPGGLVQKYRFATLKTGKARCALEATSQLTMLLTVDEDLESSDLLEVQQLGTIRVELHWKNMLGAVKKGKEKFNTSNTGSTIGTSVSEKALKGQALSHSVSFAAAEKSPDDPTRYRSEYVRASRQPAATYIFKYRSLGKLGSDLLERDC